MEEQMAKGKAELEAAMAKLKEQQAKVGGGINGWGGGLRDLVARGLSCNGGVLYSLGQVYPIIYMTITSKKRAFQGFNLCLSKPFGTCWHQQYQHKQKQMFELQSIQVHAMSPV